MKKLKAEIEKIEKGCGSYITYEYEDGDHTHEDSYPCGTLDIFGKPILCEECKKRHEIENNQLTKNGG